MQSEHLDRYLQLTEMIDQHTRDYSMELFLDAFGKNAEQKTPIQVRVRTGRDKTARIALCSLRLLANMELLSQGDQRFLDQFQQDFEDAVDAVSWVTGSFEKTDKVISETVALILLTDRSKKARFRSTLRSCLGIAPKRKLKFDSEVFSLGLGMVSFYLDKQMMEEFRAAAEGLVSLSELHNVFNPELHSSVVVECLQRVTDVDSQLALRICKDQKSLFRATADKHTALFYWNFAYAYLGSGETESALPLFLRCSKVCSQFDGENSWFAALSLARYHRIMLQKNQSGESEAFLRDFVRKAEEDYYTLTGEQTKKEGAFVRYQLLLHYLERKTLHQHFEDIQKYFDLCREYEEKVRDPRLTMRGAFNMMSAYYLEIGDFLQAEQMMQAALEAVSPEGVANMPSDDLILSNLFQIYSQMNDVEQVRKIATILAEKLQEDDLPDFERHRYFSLVQAAGALLGFSMEETIQSDKEILKDIYEALQEGDTDEFEEGGVAYAMSIMTMLAAVGDDFSATEQELHSYHTILRYLLDNPDKFPFNVGQLTIAYQELGRINWKLHNQEALVYAQKSLDCARDAVVASNIDIFTFRIAAVIYYSMGDCATAVAVAEEALKNITDAWHNVLSYINDHRICQILAQTQENYSIFYAIISAQKPPDYVYDQLLRYKDLPSLVGRERNRYLNGHGVDKELRDRVYALQDKLADAQLSDAMNGEDTVAELTRELQKAEAEFASKFPRDIQYTDISCERVGERLKENEALIEYYFVPGERSLTCEPGEEIVWELDVFVLTKVQGRLKLAHTRLPDGEQIQEDAEAFMDVMQNPEDSEWIGQKEILRERLYNSLLGFARGQLEHVSTLYIAPDLNLCNLPFEILYSEEYGVLQEEFRVCRLVCGRDLLFFDDAPTRGSKAFVLGDPDFETEKGDRSEDRFRHAAGHLELVNDLPFSGIEAQRVARRCRTTPLTGKSATKYALQEALPCRIIHLATHGRFDEQLQSDSMYSSSLIFAGYNRWLRNKTQSRDCGNGILTADEISRMDLRNTELVVLSACNSGMGDYSYRSVKGLLSAFSAAGVRWVISHIWEAEDFTTPILMDAFYYAYLSMGMDVPEALQYAKNHLRTVTIGELRRGGWLHPGNENRLSEGARMKLEAMRDANDRRKPFMDESNWGGFVCYKCK